MSEFQTYSAFEQAFDFSETREQHADRRLVLFLAKQAFENGGRVRQDKDELGREAVFIEHGTLPDVEIVWTEEDLFEGHAPVVDVLWHWIEQLREQPTTD